MRRIVTGTSAFCLALSVLSALPPTAVLAPATGAAAARSVHAHAHTARVAGALGAELRAAGDEIASVAFVDDAAGRRSAARLAADALTARAGAVASYEHWSAGDAAQLLRDLAVALRSYDIARIDSLSARRYALEIMLSRELVDAEKTQRHTQLQAK